MRKFLFISLLAVFVFAFSACNDDDDVMDTKLIKGQWEVMSDASGQNAYIYDFTTPGENTWSWGTLTTYFLTPDGEQIHDKVYDWHVSDPRNSSPVYLDIIFQGDLDTEDSWEKTEYFIVEKLTAAEMVLKKADSGDSEQKITLRRRTDLSRR